MLSRQWVSLDPPDSILALLHRSQAVDPSPFIAVGDTEQLRLPSPRFTDLLYAAQSVEVDTPTATQAVETTSSPVSALDKRRLKNRVSCRKSRLKRKLQQSALEVLVRERQQRNEYLIQVSRSLCLNPGDHSDTPNQCERETIYRKFATNSLHYALVDPAYNGWLDHEANSQVSNTIDATAQPTIRRSKRLRQAQDVDVSTAVDFPVSPQAAMFKQWLPIVDDLQNLDLTLLSVQERSLDNAVFELACHWKFVAVVTSKTQQDGEVAAIAVNGTTFVRFHGLEVQDVRIGMVQREENVSFELSPRSSRADEHDDSGSLPLGPFPV